jgi:Rab guanine nucleotide exchange factor SEC2
VENLPVTVTATVPRADSVKPPPQPQLQLQPVVSRWWHDARLNARTHLARRHRVDSDASVRVETGTAVPPGGNTSRHHTPSNSVTSLNLIDSTMGGEGLNELSTKLVEAVEKQADLEDTLAVTRHELEVANQRVKQLEQAQKEYADMMEQGMLVEKKDVEIETSELTRRLLEESKNRVQAENDKNKIEAELEALTAKLFEEANNLVAAARRESKAFEKRNEQLQSRLEDTETLLQSQQDQLVELKAVMQRMQENDNQSPPTPNLAVKPSRESIGRITTDLSPVQIAANITNLDIEPGPESAKSTDVSPFNVFVPRFRYDTVAYADFKSFVRISKGISHPRQSSGSYPSTVPGPASAYFQAIALTGKDSPPPSAPGSRNSSVSSYSPTTERLPLKEWRFVKRALTEDIEPTLRLDTAPGLSWIARRSVQSSILDGNLIIEPTPANSIMLTYACTLCGERRDEEPYIRSHRFSTSENLSNQRYPLCQYCLERMRVTCDFTGFLRAVRDGIWKTEGQEGEEKAWEESVRLRERMFWARLGIQTWMPPQLQGTKGATAMESRLSNETQGSGIDSLKEPAKEGGVVVPVTPELQFTKTFEEMEIRNAEIESAAPKVEQGGNGEAEQKEKEAPLKEQEVI